jgi:hypothetical protein
VSVYLILKVKGEKKVMKSFYVACWNLQGSKCSAFGLKSRNPEFLKEIDDVDIVELQELSTRL